jgi:membrane-bound lytic murein transglycosylase D
MAPLTFLFLLLSFSVHAAPHLNTEQAPIPIGGEVIKQDLVTIDNKAPVFDIPVTYNHKVQMWVKHFQTAGRRDFERWLGRSTKFTPFILDELDKAGLPKDIIYTAMIESGFSQTAQSHASAVGVWQFIKPTAERYGLTVNWWLDERRNYVKSTMAAIRYKKDLYQLFGSWYLVAASYNCGEHRVLNLIKKYGTNNFWELVQLNSLPKETSDYVPKIIAATLIAKAPALYGFRNINYDVPYEFDMANVPGGTDLHNLAQYLGVNPGYMKELNPDLVHGFVPSHVSSHKIKIPKGSSKLVTKYSDELTNHRQL